MCKCSMNRPRAHVRTRHAESQIRVCSLTYTVDGKGLDQRYTHTRRYIHQDTQNTDPNFLFLYTAGLQGIPQYWYKVSSAIWYIFP